VAEYNANGAVGNPLKEYGYRNGQLLVVWDGSETVDKRLQWLVQDHLGSTRMVVDRSGNLAGIRRHDFLPFGEELPAGVGIRSAGIGYGGDSVRQKFTGKERDEETGLDYLLARYHSSLQGRFTSADSFLGFIVNPQTLNLYAYVQNNPLAFADPTGHWSEPKDGNDEDFGRRLKELQDIASSKMIDPNYCLCFKDWKKEESKDNQGRPIVRYTWVDDPNVHDVPNNHSYVDVDGNFIQLWAYGGEHGWEYVTLGPTRAIYTKQPGQPPVSFSTVEDTAAALTKVGYVENNLDPLHIGRQFFLKTSPTFHVTVNGEISVRQISSHGPGITFVTARGTGPISSVDFHYESHTQGGSFKDGLLHIWDFLRGKP
jgi:RHS repeat-associated protein